MTLSQQRLWQVAIVVFIGFELYVAALGLEVYFGFWLAAVMVMGSNISAGCGCEVPDVRLLSTSSKVL